VAKRGAHHRWTLVDGHNLLYRDPELQRYMPEDPERARKALERRLAGRARTHLFYDGGPGGRPSRAHRQGLELHYSGAGSADDAIVAWLRAHPDRRSVVITTDRELAARARAHGAQVAGSRALGGGERGDDAPMVDDGDRGPPSPNEVDQWLREFGAEDDAGA